MIYRFLRHYSIHLLIIKRVYYIHNILNDFYIAQEKLLGNNYNENADMKEAINQILTEIFFNEPFDKYTNKFYSVVKKSSRQYLAENILDGKKYSSFIDFLEKEIINQKMKEKEMKKKEKDIMKK